MNDHTSDRGFVLRRRMLVDHPSPLTGTRGAIHMTISAIEALRTGIDNLESGLNQLLRSVDLCDPRHEILQRIADLKQACVALKWHASPPVAATLAREDASQGADWRLVPVEPTREMLNAGRAFNIMTEDVQAAYGAMIKAAPLATPAPRGEVEGVDELAQEIRRIDGSNSLGAGALAEALMPFLRRARRLAGG